MLWIGWLTANTTMWIHEATSAWVMTALTDSALMVAMVATAASLPVFLLSLPAGALADIVNRRKYYALTQLLTAAVALVLCGLSATDTLTPPLLIGLTFVNGIATAMRWPVYSAIIPSLIPRHDLPAALALNAVAMNASRIIGPLVAGTLLATAGAGYVFLFNAVLSTLTFALVLRWHPDPDASPPSGERLGTAIRVGIQHVSQSRHLRIVVARIFLFFFQASSLTALLPLMTRQNEGHGSTTFTVLLAAMGTGALIMALNLGRLRARLRPDALIWMGVCGHALASAIAVMSPALWIALPAMVVAGMAWMGTANTLTVAAQLALPGWVRARGMSIYHMALMGGGAAGAALWGYVANLVSVQASVLIAAIAGPLLLLLTMRCKTASVDEHLSPIVPKGSVGENSFNRTSSKD